MFPARKLGGGTSGSGEWLMAFKATEKERFQATLSAFPRSLSPTSRRTINTPMSDPCRPLVLSRSLLLELHRLSAPEDLCVARVSGMGLNEWEEGDECELVQFLNLSEVDAADNSLQLEAFSQLPALRKLDLSVNQISNLNIEDTDFRTLQVLDLSANSLSIDSILRIGFLAGLRELHLSGNDLHSLPEEMARPLISVDCFGLVTSQRERFPLLEKLWLDHNVFEDVRVFAILAGLKKLAYLNLSHNNIYSLPHLHFLPKEVIQRIEEEGGGVEGVISGISAMNVSLNPQNTPAPNAAGTVGTSSEAKRDSKGDEADNLARILSDISVISRHQSTHHTPTIAITDSGGYLDTLRPYPSLIELDLSNNIICYPEDVLACSKWKSLTHLKLHGNPVTSQQKGVPPLIQTEFVDKGKQVSLAEVKFPKKPKEANKMAAVLASSAPLKIQDSLPPLPAKRPFPLALSELNSPPGDAYSHASTLTPISQAKTYPGNFPQGSATSLPSLPTHERRPSTVVTGKMQELMSSETPRYKHRRVRLDTESDETSFPHTLAPSRETFFMTQSEKDPREDEGEDREENLRSGKMSLFEEEPYYPTLPSECLSELRDVLKETAGDLQLERGSRVHKNILSSTRELAYLLHHPVSLPTHVCRGMSGREDSDTLDIRYKNCVERRNNLNKKDLKSPVRAITDCSRKRETEVERSLSSVMKRGNSKDKKEVERLFTSLQHKYDSIRSSTHYQADIKLSPTNTQNPQVH